MAMYAYFYTNLIQKGDNTWIEQLMLQLLVLELLVYIR